MINVGGKNVNKKVQDLSNLVVDVSAYNAKGDGTTDDSPAIQAAINAIGSNGGTIIFPPGKVYKIGSPGDGIAVDAPRVLLNKNKVKILGYGATILNGVNKGISTFKIMGQDIDIEGLKFDGNNTSINTLHIGNAAARVSLSNCEVAYSKQLTGDTVAASGVMISSGSTDVLIDNCHVHHIDAPITYIARGIYATSYDSGGATTFKRVTIQNCLIEDITPYQDADGIQLINTDATVGTDSAILNNRFYRCAKRGIKLSCSNVVVSGNYIELGTYDAVTGMYAGISVYGNDIRVMGNTIKGDYAAYGIENGATGSVIGNRVTISNNEIKMITVGAGRGIGVIGGTSITDVVISSNILSTLQNGVYLACSGDRMTITGNTISDCSQSGVISNGTGGTYINRLTVMGNAFTGITQYCIRFNGGTQCIEMGNTSDLTGFGTYGNASERISTIGNMIVGTTIQTHGSAIPTTGTWKQGDVIWNTAAAGGGKVGWVCTSNGTPGQWKAFGVIDA